MKLKEFIEKFICKNSLIRLWKPIKGCKHQMLIEEDKKVCMEWELLDGKVWQSKYLENEVIGINDIVVNDFYREAINIVIKA